MSVFGKADSQGRSSGKYNGRIGELMRPPKDQSWIWITRELMQSDAWLNQSRKCRIFVDALLLDSMANAGQENGRLKATYDQLTKLGLARSSVSKAITEAKFLGLVRCITKGGRYGGNNKPSEYRLTFYSTVSEDGIIYSMTNDWKKVSKEDVELWRKNEKLRRVVIKQKREKQFAGPKNDTSSGRILGLAEVSLRVVK